MKNLIYVFFVFFSFFLIPFQTFSINKPKDCYSGDCKNGFGIEISNSGKYIGHFKDGLKDGFGVYHYKNGDKYIGNWKEGLRSGLGSNISTLNSSITQSGIWNEDKFIKEKQLNKCVAGDCKNGYGIYWSAKQEQVFFGIFNKNGIHKGMIIYYDGSKYIGKINKKKKTGEGDWYGTNGEYLSGLWADDIFLGASKSVKGCVEGDCANGMGVYIYKDYTTYSGKFRDNLAEGHGECFYSDGDYYKGNFYKHSFSGYGALHLTTGKIMEGYWENGEYVGQSPKNTKLKVNISAIIIGVSRYKNFKSLKYTDDDAYRIYAFLKSPEGGALKDNQITLLIDEDATQQNIMEKTKEVFSKAQEEDVVLFYFSGHGLKGSFLPYDYDKRNNDAKVLHSFILEHLNQCKAKAKVVIADACHSGSMADNYSIKGIESETIAKSYYEAFQSTSGGTAIISSSKADETSIENNGFRQGIFSYFLVLGLKGAADLNNDKVITVHELFTYVKSNVEDYTYSLQNPTIIGNFDKKMPLGVIR